MQTNLSICEFWGFPDLIQPQHNARYVIWTIGIQPRNAVKVTSYTK